MSDPIVDAVHAILPCWCDSAYKDRGLAQPDCPRCNFANEVIDLVRDTLSASRK